MPLVNRAVARLAGWKVPEFVPLFVGRFTRERLREDAAALSQAEKGA
ncbi:MAG TPA: hypothetical protein VFL29_02180 [Candidatus Dormibacteraeota bacterium]|nr:hypothetical protein [Candidatus Dormibacteraeota bacterium]